MKQIHWKTEPTVILNDNDLNLPHWFPNGQMNISYNCIDRHCSNNEGKDVAMIYDCPYTEIRETRTYSEVLQSVSKLTHILKKKFDIKEGD